LTDLALQQPQTGPSLGEVLLSGLLVVGGTYLTVKALQALFDDEYDGRTLPSGVRRGLIEDHLDRNGEWCPGWGVSSHYADEEDLTIDHIRPWSKGGSTSIYNSQVLCRSCNSSKGDRMTILDRLRGL